MQASTATSGYQHQAAAAAQQQGIRLAQIGSRTYNSLVALAASLSQGSATFLTLIP
jgi:hypothetical protein